MLIVLRYRGFEQEGCAAIVSNARLSVDHVNGVDRGLLSGRGDGGTRPGVGVVDRLGLGVAVVLVAGIPGAAVDAREHRGRDRCGQPDDADHRQPVRPEHFERRPLGLAVEVGLVHAGRAVAVAVAPQRGADARVQLRAAVRAPEPVQRLVVQRRRGGRGRVVVVSVDRRRRWFGHLQPFEGHGTGFLGHELDHETGVLAVGGHVTGPLVREHVYVAPVVARARRTNVPDQPDGGGARPADRVQQYPVARLARGRGRVVQRQKVAPRLHEHAVLRVRLEQPRVPVAVQVVAGLRRVREFDLAAGAADPLLARARRRPEHAHVRVEVRVGKVLGDVERGHAEPDLHAVGRRVERHVVRAERGFGEVLAEAAALHAHAAPVHLGHRQPGTVTAVTAVVGRARVPARHRLGHHGPALPRTERRVPHDDLHPVPGLGLQPVHAVQVLGAAPAVQENVPRLRDVHRPAHRVLDHARPVVVLAVVRAAVHKLVVQPEAVRLQHGAQHRVHLQYHAGRLGQVALVQRARSLRCRRHRAVIVGRPRGHRGR